MEDPKERLTKCISTAELECRWKAVREKMREKKIDYLVIQNSEEYLAFVIPFLFESEIFREATELEELCINFQRICLIMLIFVV